MRLSALSGLLPVLLLTLPGCGGGSAPDLTPRAYAITDLGADAAAYGINGRGEVVGTAGGHAVVWQDGQMTDLGTLGGPTSAAVAINDSGQVVGNSTVQTVYDSHPFLWERGRMIDLGPATSTFSYATGINESAQIVGYSDDETHSTFRAWLWEDGRRTELGALPGDNNSQAMGINAAGQVIGQSYFIEPCQGGDCGGGYAPRGFVWQNGGIRRISLPGGAETAPSAINNIGQVVGSPGFMWLNGFTIPLGTTGIALSEPLAINSRGQVVGFAWEAGALLYSGGRVIDLNNLIPPRSGWLLGRANGINDAGLIVGTGTLNGRQHAFLLTPQ